MRTKHLFTAMALVALFASCTKDEFAPVNGVDASNGRAMVENVSFNFVQDASTRLAYNGTYNWAAGDQIGACLMDEITGAYNTSSVWAERFDLVNYIQTNYKFTRDAEANWETEAKLCEGNYFLTYPYNKNMGLRQAYTFSCANQVMEGTDVADLMNTFVKANSFVGYAAIEANDNEGESVAVAMTPVFESNGFILNNTGSNTYKIEKIVLTGSKISASATITPLNANYSVNAKKLETATNKDVLTFGSDERIDVAILAENVIAPLEEIKTIVMTGIADLHENNDGQYNGEAVLEIHTDKGLIRGIQLNKHYTSDNGQISGVNGTVNVLTSKAFAKIGAADQIRITFDDTSLDVPNTMDIYSSDELYRLIKWNTNINNVNVVADLKADVELTAEMYDILKNSGKYGEGKSTLTINGANDYAVTIPADVPADAMDLVTFVTVKEVVVEGTQTIANNITVPVVVEEGAAFNVSAQYSADITVYGTLTFTTTEENVAAETGTISNYGSVAIEGANTLQAYSFVNLADVTVANAAKFVALAGKNTGTVTVNGEFNGKSAFENDVKFVVDYIDNDPAKPVYYYPTINVNGKVEGVVNNSVMVMAAAGKAQTITGAGEIDNSNLSKYVDATTKANNTVFYRGSNLTVTNMDKYQTENNIELFYVSGTLSVEAAKIIAEVVAEGDLNVTSTKSGSFTKFTVAEGTITLVKANSTLTVTNLFVDGTLEIETGAKVDYTTTTVGTNGKVSNYGIYE